MTKFETFFYHFRFPDRGPNPVVDRAPLDLGTQGGPSPSPQAGQAPGRPGGQAWPEAQGRAEGSDRGTPPKSADRRGPNRPATAIWGAQRHVRGFLAVVQSWQEDRQPRRIDAVRKRGTFSHFIYITFSVSITKTAGDRDFGIWRSMCKMWINNKKFLTFLLQDQLTFRGYKPNDKRKN